MTASIRLSAALVLVPLLASAQPAIQSPPAAFQLPSGNIHCRFAAGELRCEALARDFAPPAPPAGCPQGWRGGLALGAEGPPRLICPADSVRDDEAFVLGYGARWVGPGIACEAAEDGLSCMNGGGRGFRVSRSALALF